MRIIFCGTSFKLNAPVDETILSSSISIPGKGVTSEPVAIIMFFVATFKEYIRSSKPREVFSNLTHRLHNIARLIKNDNFIGTGYLAMTAQVGNLVLLEQHGYTSRQSAYCRFLGLHKFAKI